MKNRCIAILFTLIFLMNLTACVDFNAGKRPVDQKNTRWRSADPDIYFDVSDEYREITRHSTYGKINIGGVITEIEVVFGHGASVYFDTFSGGNPDNAVWLFSGGCIFSNDKLVVHIDNRKEAFLDDSIKTITFYREEIK
jgi:hypothetical protein